MSENNRFKTEFVMYAGLHTIGGVIFSVTYGRDRVILEFGSAYDPATAVFDGNVEPRDENWVRDMLKVGLLPKIDGLYAQNDLGSFPLVPAEKSGLNTAIFVTHLHLDHMALMGAVHKDIPIYMHHNAVTIERALEATGAGIRTAEREYMDVVPNEPIRVGEIEVLPVLCRNTSYYDFAYLVTTPDGTIHWTGDLCLHGKQADKTLAQMEMLRKRGVDVMLCDCTAFMDGVMRMMYKDAGKAEILPSPDVPKGMLNETEFYDGLYSHIEGHKGLCVFNYYQREMDDAEQFIKWADASCRKCAFEPDAAYIVHKFFGIRPYVFVPDSKRYKNCREPWFLELMENCNVVTNADIWKNPGGYLLQNSYRHIMELMSLPCENGVYIHADGIPIGDFDPSYANMVKIVKKAGFEYVTFFCENYFGHGYPPQVKYFVDTVDPGVLIPCHSYNPERLLPKNGKQLLPKMYEKYILCNHALHAAAEEETNE